MKPFRWKNCRADIAAARHDRTIQAFYDDVIRPTIEALNSRLANLKQSNDPVAAFEHYDTEEVLSETKKAFALSVQSIWERQLRGYLRGCAEELQPEEGGAKKIDKIREWKDLQKSFRNLRGIGIEEFPSFKMLDTLHYLGSACRHGDGSSATELGKRHPEWWPEPISFPLPHGFGPPNPPARTIASMEIPTECLAGFVSAIVKFWADTTYIYNESIEVKHPQLEAQLVRERAERDWCPQARGAGT